MSLMHGVCRRSSVVHVQCFQGTSCVLPFKGVALTLLVLDNGFAANERFHLKISL